MLSALNAAEAETVRLFQNAAATHMQAANAVGIAAFHLYSRASFVAEADMLNYQKQKCRGQYD